MSGTCLSNIACLILATGSDSSFTGLLHWMRPPITLRDMEAFLEREMSGAPRRTRAGSGPRDELRRSEPPRDGHLLVGVELDRVLPMRLEIAEEAALRPAEREEGHGRGDADVHAEHARLDVPAILARRLAAAREDAGGVTELVPLHDRDRLLERVGLHDAQHGAEDL